MKSSDLEAGKAVRVDAINSTSKDDSLGQDSGCWAKEWKTRKIQKYN